MMQTRCKGTKSDGTPCSGNTFKGSEYCWFHDPGQEAKRNEGRRLGGYARSNVQRAKKELPCVPLTNSECHAWLSLAFREALVGKRDAPMLNALSTAAKTLAELSKSVELEDQLADMRRQIVDLSERRAAS